MQEGQAQQHKGAVGHHVLHSSTCVLPSVKAARRAAEVVLVLADTAATFRPASALTRLDLPALGAPTIAACMPPIPLPRLVALPAVLLR